MTTDVKPCPICNETKPLAEFSALTDRALDLKNPIGAHCTACYWRNLVLNHASYRIGEDGKCIVDYLPLPAPRLDYVAEMQQWLPARLASKDVQAVFADLGNLEAQVRPFREFAAGLSALGQDAAGYRGMK